jgi:hypothetical protein
VGPTVATIIRFLGGFLLRMQLEVLFIAIDVMSVLLSMLDALPAIRNVVWYLQE